MVTEGIENALSVMQAMGGSAWAALSESGVRALVLPAEVRGVVICADGDAVGESYRGASVRGQRAPKHGRSRTDPVWGPKP